MPKKKVITKKTTAKKVVRKKATSKKSTARKKATSVPKKKAAKKRAAKKKTSGKPAQGVKSKANKEKTKQQDRSCQQLLTGVPTVATVVFSGSIPTAERPYLIERILTPQDVSVEYKLRSNELDSDFEKAGKALREWLDDFKKSPQYQEGHITGTSVTFRRSFGHIVSPLQVVIVINVARKYSKEKLKDKDLKELPKVIDGIPVKILEGVFSYISNEEIPSRVVGASTISGQVQPERPLPLTEESPLMGGIPIAQSSSPNQFGTLSVVLEEDGKTIGLTNYHVLDDGRSNTGTVQIGDEGFGDVRTIGFPNSRRKVLGSRTELNLSGSVDCAVIDLKGQYLDDDKLLKNSIRDLTHLTTVVEDIDANGNKRKKVTVTDTGIPLFYADTQVDFSRDHGLSVCKFGGRSGELFEGRLMPQKDSVVRIFDRDFSNLIFAIHQEANQIFVPGGDSASALLLKTMIQDDDTGELIPAFVLAGLLFAQINGNASIGIACHFSQVKKALKLKINKKLLKKDWVTDNDLITWELPK